MGSYFSPKPDRSGCRLLESHEPWQFENPLISVTADGRVAKSKLKMPERVKATIPPMRPISEILDNLGKKEGDSVDFHTLPEDKQLKIIADEYNSNTPTKEIAAKLGISIGALYARIRKAQETGLITELRSQSSQEGGGQPAQVSSAAIPSAKVRAKVVKEPRATVEDFISQLEEARQKAQTYQERMELLSQAAKIAQAVEELLGERAGPVLAMLYMEVAG